MAAVIMLLERMMEIRANFRASQVLPSFTLKLASSKFSLSTNFELSAISGARKAPDDKLELGALNSRRGSGVYACRTGQLPFTDYRH